jgi:hypothetical protein
MPAAARGRGADPGSWPRPHGGCADSDPEAVGRAGQDEPAGRDLVRAPWSDLRQGGHRTLAHRRWLARQVFEHTAQRIVLQEKVDASADAAQQLHRLDEQQSTPSPALAEATWTYRYPAGLSETLRVRLEGLPELQQDSRITTSDTGAEASQSAPFRPFAERRKECPTGRLGGGRGTVVKPSPLCFQWLIKHIILVDVARRMWTRLSCLIRRNGIWTSGLQLWQQRAAARLYARPPRPCANPPDWRPATRPVPITMHFRAARDS